jgi:hypothetical protein
MILDPSLTVCQSPCVPFAICTSRAYRNTIPSFHKLGEPATSLSFFLLGVVLVFLVVLYTELAKLGLDFFQTLQQGLVRRPRRVCRQPPCEWLECSHECQ